MAKAHSDEIHAAAGDPVPIFRRAKPEDALDLARSTFLAGDRVDMQALATQLGVSRATLYRWVGSRDQLLEAILLHLAHRFIADAHANASGEGDERVLDFVRQIMNPSVQFPPARTFVAREPQLALRLLLAEHGAIHQALAEGVLAELAETRSPDEAEAITDQVDVLVQVATALQWATLSIGDEPHIERAIQVVREILSASRTTRT
jgi:AcrR family transcriptional regulator